MTAPVDIDRLEAEVRDALERNTSESLRVLLAAASLALVACGPYTPPLPPSPPADTLPPARTSICSAKRSQGVSMPPATW